MVAFHWKTQSVHFDFQTGTFADLECKLNLMYAVKSGDFCLIFGNIAISTNLSTLISKIIVAKFMASLSEKEFSFL